MKQYGYTLKHAETYTKFRLEYHPVSVVQITRVSHLFGHCHKVRVLLINMQLFVSLVICAFLAVHGQPDNTSQQTCQVGRVCGVLENILRKQERLEKKVEEHSKILGGASCPEGKIFVDYFVLVTLEKQAGFCSV